MYCRTAARAPVVELPVSARGMTAMSAVAGSFVVGPADGPIMTVFFLFDDVYCLWGLFHGSYNIPCLSQGICLEGVTTFHALGVVYSDNILVY